jgi:tetrahydromethanopterin S-methyltransferase subunit B
MPRSVVGFSALLGAGFVAWGMIEYGFFIGLVFLALLAWGLLSVVLFWAMNLITWGGFYNNP